MRQHLEFQLTRPSGYEPPFRLTRYVGLVLARYPHTHSLYTETLLLVPERRQQPADAPEGVAVRKEGPKASSCQTATGTESSNIFTQGLKCRSLRGSIIPASARVEVQTWRQPNRDRLSRKPRYRSRPLQRNEPPNPTSTRNRIGRTGHLSRRHP